MTELELPINVRLLGGNPRIEDTRGKADIMRGPIVYCIEETDHQGCFEGAGDLNLLSLGLTANFKKDMLGGVLTINGAASLNTAEEKINHTVITYFAWCNREQGQMKVWLPLQMQKFNPIRI